MKRKERCIYRLFDHTADLGVEIYGDDARSLFANAATTLFEMMVSSAEGGNVADAGDDEEEIDVSGADWPDLMVNWLRELLYLWTVRQRILVGLRIEAIEENGIRARLETCPFDAHRHVAEREIKAVTYHQVAAGPQGDRWRARVIFDI